MHPLILNMQFIASAPTLFPPEYVQEFQYCFDRAPTIPFQEIQAILHQELGRPIDTVFEFVDPDPVASASIAQVGIIIIVLDDYVNNILSTCRSIYSIKTSVSGELHILIFRCMVPG